MGDFLFQRSYKIHDPKTNETMQIHDRPPVLVWEIQHNVDGKIVSKTISKNEKGIITTAEFKNSNEVILTFNSEAHYLNWLNTLNLNCKSQNVN